MFRVVSHTPAQSFQAASFTVPQYYSVPHPHTQHTFAPPYNDVTSWHLRHQEQLRRQAAPAQVRTSITPLHFFSQITYVFVYFVSVVIRLSHNNHFGRSTKSRLVATCCWWHHPRKGRHHRQVRAAISCSWTDWLKLLPLCSFQTKTANPRSRAKFADDGSDTATNAVSTRHWRERSGQHQVAGAYWQDFNNKSALS